MQIRLSVVALAFAVVFPSVGHAVDLPADQNSLLQEHILTMINASREEFGGDPVSHHDGLERVAEGHCRDTATHFDPENVDTRESSYLSHISSDGRTLIDRYNDAGVATGIAYAENVGYWIRTPYGVVFDASKAGLELIHNGMMAEVPPNDGHRKNILGHYTHVGIAICVLNSSQDSTNVVFLVTNYSFYGTPEEWQSIHSVEEEPEGAARSLTRVQRVMTEGPFPDVSKNHEFAESIFGMKESGYLEGYPDGNFRPNRTVNRAELLKVLQVARDFSPIGREFSKCFDDVSDQWFAPYVCVAKREGWVEGYEDNTFRPDNPVTRAEAVALLSRIYELSIEFSAMTPYEDVEEDAWYWQWVQSAASNGLVSFIQGEFDPHRGMTRGEVAEMVWNASNK